jgi:hypothetical protein
MGAVSIFISFRRGQSLRGDPIALKKQHGNRRPQKKVALSECGSAYK